MFISNQLNQYIEELIQSRSSLLNEMETYAAKQGVPIMELVGIETMLQILKIQQPKRVLEVGTAIGYSAIRIASALPETQVVSIERDHERYKLALAFIERAGLQDRIDVILGDALEVEDEVQRKGPYDSLFIDAAKGQYQRFFEIYSKMVNPKGVIFSDNVLFKGLVTEHDIEKKSLRSMVQKLKDYNEWLMSHTDYETTIIPVGDGIAVSKKR